MAVTSQSSLTSRVVVPVPCPDRNPRRESWHVMEVVKRQLSITATAFHKTSTRSIPGYSPPRFWIITTACQSACQSACQFASYAKTPLRKSVYTISTTHSHLVFSRSSFPSSPPSLAHIFLPSGSDYAVIVDDSIYPYPTHCYRSHSRRFSARIREGPPDLCPCSLCTAYSTSSSVGT